MTEKVKQHAAPVTGSDEIDIGRLVGTGRTVETKKMSAKAISVVKMIDTHGERRPAKTFANTGGSTFCLAIP